MEIAEIVRAHVRLAEVDLGDGNCSPVLSDRNGFASLIVDSRIHPILVVSMKVLLTM